VSSRIDCWRNAHSFINEKPDETIANINVTDTSSIKNDSPKLAKQRNESIKSNLISSNSKPRLICMPKRNLPSHRQTKSFSSV